MKSLMYICILTFLIGCGSGSCITFGGGYKDFTGEIEYCFSKKDSKASGTIALENKEGNKLFGFSLDEILSIEKLLEKIDEDVVKSKIIQHPVRNILSKLKKFRGK